MINRLLRIKKVKLVLIIGKDNEKISKFVYELISEFYSVKKIDYPHFFFGKLSFLFKDVVLLNGSDVDVLDLSKFLSSFRDVVVLINSNDLNREKEIVSKLSKENTILVDFESKSKIPAKRMNKFLSFGTDSDADFYVSDVKTGKKTNFKINYDGSSVPVWIDSENSIDDVLGVASGLGVGVLLGVNFVSLTQKLKNSWFIF